MFLPNGTLAKAHRLKLGLSQGDFWSKLGATQSAGSRYESGRDISVPMQLLLHIAYAPEKQVAELVDFLRAK